MEKSTKKTVVALGGDGIGPECVDVTCDLLEKAGFNLNIIRPLNGERALKEGKHPFSDEVKQMCEKSDANIFGANGGTSRPILFHLRWNVDNYMNIRPGKFYEGSRSSLKDISGTDFVIFRELSEELYPGQEGDLDYLSERIPEYRGSMGRSIADYGKGKFALRIISEKGCKRLAEYVCQYTLERKKKGYPGKLTCASKASILRETDGLFRRIIEEGVKKYPELAYEHLNVDDAARRLVRYPKDFDVMVMPNIFGDILSDEAAEICGGLGMAGAAALGGRVPLFEPSHGSAPKYAGKNVTNPTATIISARLMLEYFGMNDEANALEKAIESVYKEGKHLTYDQGGTASTTECADAILRAIK